MNSITVDNIPPYKKLSDLRKEMCKTREEFGLIVGYKADSIKRYELEILDVPAPLAVIVSLLTKKVDDYTKGYEAGRITRKEKREASFQV